MTTTNPEPARDGGGAVGLEGDPLDAALAGVQGSLSRLAARLEEDIAAAQPAPAGGDVAAAVGVFDVPRCGCDAPVHRNGERCTLCEAAHVLQREATVLEKRARDEVWTAHMGQADNAEARRLRALADGLKSKARVLAAHEAAGVAVEERAEKAEREIARMYGIFGDYDYTPTTWAECDRIWNECRQNAITAEQERDEARREFDGVTELHAEDLLALATERARAEKAEARVHVLAGHLGMETHDESLAVAAKALRERAEQADGQEAARLRLALEDIADVTSYSIDNRDAWHDAVGRAEKDPPARAAESAGGTDA